MRPHLPRRVMPLAPISCALAPAAALLLAGACGGSPALPDGAPDAVADAPPDATPCPAPTGAGTTHASSIAAAETWRAADGPHLVPGDLGVHAVVTIEPCAIVKVGAAATITVGPGGAIDAAGLPGQPITFTRKDATAWGAIALVGGDATLTHVVLAGGGAPLAKVTDRGVLDARAMSGAPAGGLVTATDLEIADAASIGVYLHDGGRFDPSSTDVRVHGAASFPLRTWGSAAGSIPAGAYTGNADDELAIDALGVTDAIVADTTLHARGVPYHVGVDPTSGRLDVAAPAGVATLTIEPGVTLRFAAGGSLRVEPFQGTQPARGALVAVGTAAAPITFTSAAAAPAPGDWLGVWFGETVDARSRVQFATVAYAGGASTSGTSSCGLTGQSPINDAGIRILSALPPAEFITDTTIAHSARHGIDRGWRSDTKTDFLAGNAFTDVAGCKETYPSDASGACPNPVPCP